MTDIIDKMCQAQYEALLREPGHGKCGDPHWSAITPESKRLRAIMMRAALGEFAEWLENLPVDRRALPFVRAISTPTGEVNDVTGKPELSFNMGDLKRFAAGVRAVALPLAAGSAT